MKSQRCGIITVQARRKQFSSDKQISVITEQPSAAQRSTVDIYADDTTLSFSSDMTNGLLGLTSALQQDLDDLSQWLAGNNMVTNAAETKCLLVTGKCLTNRIVDGSLNLHLGNSNAEQVESQKLLGLTIDRHLSFNIHVERLCKKQPQKKAVYRKIRRFLPTEQGIPYYNAMIQQPILQESTVWWNLSRDNITRVFKLQKRAAREADIRSNSVKLFKKLPWLRFYDKVK